MCEYVTFKIGMYLGPPSLTHENPQIFSRTPLTYFYFIFHSAPLMFSNGIALK